MAIETATLGSTITSSASASDGAGARLEEDYTNFLKLLTAQISNQDPLEPMDASTFVSQLAQLSQVEQTIAVNANLEDITNRLATTGAMADIGLIGRQVKLESDHVELIDSSGTFDYELARAADTVTARILAGDGTVIREFEGLPGTTDALHTVGWDGLDSEGMPVPDSVFKIEVEAETADGNAVASKTYAATTVEEVSFASGTAMLKLRNGTEASSTQVVSIQ